MKQTLLRRFRWPLLALTWSSAQLAGTAFYYHDTKLTTVGLVVFFIAAGIAVVLNSIDESPKTIAEKYETKHGIENNQNTES